MIFFASRPFLGSVRFQERKGGPGTGGRKEFPLRAAGMLAGITIGEAAAAPASGPTPAASACRRPPLCKMHHMRNAEFCELLPLKSEKIHDKIALYKEKEGLLL